MTDKRKQTQGMPWFRWWGGTMTDPKFKWVAKKSGQSISSVLNIWVALLEHANSIIQNEDVTPCDVTVTRGDVSAFDCEDIDAFFDFEYGTTQSIYDAFIAKGMIIEGRLAAWGKRQPIREDSSAERTRAYRERLKQRQSETPSNAMQRHVTPCDAIDRDIDKESKSYDELHSSPDLLTTSPKNARDHVAEREEFFKTFNLEKFRYDLEANAIVISGDVDFKLEFERFKAWGEENNWKDKSGIPLRKLDIRFKRWIFDEQKKRLQMDRLPKVIKTPAGEPKTERKPLSGSYYIALQNKLKRGEKLTEEEKDWIAAYEAEQQAAAKPLTQEISQEKEQERRKQSGVSYAPVEYLQRWRKVHDYIQEAAGQAAYRSWYEQMRLQEVTDGEAVFAVQVRPDLLLDCQASAENFLQQALTILECKSYRLVKQIEPESIEFTNPQTLNIIKAADAKAAPRREMIMH